MISGRIGAGMLEVPWGPVVWPYYCGWGEDLAGVDRPKSSGEKGQRGTARLRTSCVYSLCPTVPNMACFAKMLKGTTPESREPSATLTQTSLR